MIFKKTNSKDINLIKLTHLKTFQLNFLLKKKLIIIPMIGFLIHLSDSFLKNGNLRKLNSLYEFLKIHIKKFNFMIFIFQYYDLFLKALNAENRLKIVRYEKSILCFNDQNKRSSYLQFFEKNYHASLMHLRKLLNISGLPLKKSSSKIFSKWKRINPAKGITRFTSTPFREWGWRVSLGVKTPDEVTALVFEEQEPKYQSEIQEFDLDLAQSYMNLFHLKKIVLLW